MKTIIAGSRTLTDAGRHFTPCNCRYQKEKNWGYAAFKHVRTKKYWAAVGVYLDPEDMMREIKPIKCVLVKCMGCGSEPIREHPERP